MQMLENRIDRSQATYSMYYPTASISQKVTLELEPFHTPRLCRPELPRSLDLFSLVRTASQSEGQ
jgi:hypothetical protein